MLIVLNLGITLHASRASRSAGTSAACSGGVIAGFLLFEVGERMRRDALAYAGCAVLAAAAVFGSIAVA